MTDYSFSTLISFYSNIVLQNFAYDIRKNTVTSQLRVAGITVLNLNEVIEKCMDENIPLIGLTNTQLYLCLQL